MTNSSSSSSSKPILYYDLVCMNALTALNLVTCAGLSDKVELSTVSLQNGEQLKPEYMEKFPLHHIPGLKISDEVYVDESATILRYLANTFPEECNKYYPTDNPAKRATIERAMDWRNTEYMPALTSATYGLLWGVPDPMYTNPEVVAKAVENVSAALQYLANHLLKGKKFIADDEPSLAEFHIIPSIATIRAFDGAEREMKIPDRVEQWIQDFNEACPEALENQNKVQIPHMSNMNDIFKTKIPKKRINK